MSAGGKQMKNKSLRYPYPTILDHFFDTDKNGKLGISETVLRDSQLKKIEQRKQNKRIKKNNVFPYQH